MSFGGKRRKANSTRKGSHVPAHPRAQFWRSPLIQCMHRHWLMRRWAEEDRRRWIEAALPAMQDLVNKILDGVRPGLRPSLSFDIGPPVSATFGEFVKLRDEVDREIEKVLLGKGDIN